LKVIKAIIIIRCLDDPSDTVSCALSGHLYLEMLWYQESCVLWIVEQKQWWCWHVNTIIISEWG